MNWLLDWFSQIWNFLVGLKNSIAGWFTQTQTKIAAVQTAVDALAKSSETNFQACLDRQRETQELITETAISDRMILLDLVATASAIHDFLTTGPPAQNKLIFSIQIEGNTLQGVTQMTLKPGKKYRASVKTQPERSRVDGALSWVSSDESVLTATPEGDGKTAIVETLADGVATLTVSGDADLSEGTRTIEVTVGVIVGLEAESARLLDRRFRDLFEVHRQAKDSPC